jgi:nitroreductase
LNSSLEAIEQDIEDLEDALHAAQSNPSQFNLTAKDLNARKRFLDNSRNSIQNIRNTMANPPIKGRFSPNGSPVRILLRREIL